MEMVTLFDVMTDGGRRGKLEQTLSAERREEERETDRRRRRKGETPTTNTTRASEGTERKGEMKCNGRTGYRKLKLNQEIPSNVVPHPFQRAQGTYKIDIDASKQCAKWT